MTPTLRSLIERLKRRESDTTLQRLLEEALEGISDFEVLRPLAQEHFHSMEIGLPIMQRMIELEPRNDEIMAMLASLHAMHLEVRPARQWAKRALRLNGQNLAALYAFSTTSADPLVRLNDADVMLAIDPHYYPAVRHKADALQRLGRHKDAERTWRTHLKWLKKSPNVDPSEIRATEAGLAQAYENPNAAARRIERFVFGTDADE